MDKCTKGEVKLSVATKIKTNPDSTLKIFVGQDLESLVRALLADDLAIKRVQVTSFTCLKRMIFLSYVNFYVLYDHNVAHDYHTTKNDLVNDE